MRSRRARRARSRPPGQRRAAHPAQSPTLHSLRHGSSTTAPCRRCGLQYLVLEGQSHKVEPQQDTASNPPRTA